MDNPLLRLSEQDDKTKALKALLLELKKTDKAEDSVIAQRSGSFIVAVFSAAITIAGVSVMPPIIGGALIGACVASAGGTIVTLAGEIFKKQTTSSKELLAVLSSKEVKQWVKLWERSGDTELFLTALEYACQGELIEINGREVFRHDDGRHPFDVAHQWILDGASSEAPTQPQEPTVSSRTKLQEDFVGLIQQKKPVPATNNQQPTTNNSQTVNQPAPNLDPTTEQVGLEILDAMVKTRRSTLLIGDTGAGKSVTQAYVLTQLFELQPNAEVFVLAQKADSFCGLAIKGRVTLFDPTEPEQALILIGSIWKLYDTRRRLPEEERPALSPVRLILADWLSINQALEELKNEESVKNSKYLTKLADIIYNGRELNVCLLVDLQSYNLAAVGLKADRNSRKNFNLIGLGNYSVDELGMVNESYGVLTNLIGDRYIVADESERSALNATFKQLQPISKANCRPVIFSGLSPARLALLPDLRKYKNSTVSAVAKQPMTTVDSVTQSQPEDVTIAPTETTTELKVSDSLAEPLKSIWLFTKEQQNWVTARDIQRKNFAVLKGKNSEQIHQYLGLLADTGYGQIDEEGKSHSSVAFLAH